MREKILLKNCLLYNNIFQRFFLSDILIEDFIIKRIDIDIKDTNAKTIDLEKSYVSYGFVDLHTHCFNHKNIAIGSNPDDIGIKMGVPTIVDAGSAGAKNFDIFYNEIIQSATTNIYAFLNIADYGLQTLHELDDLSNINEENIVRTVNKYKHIILGLKVRASSSVVKNNGIKPLVLAKKIAKKLKLPVMVHIGNAPPKIDDILDLLDKGDIITHCYHGKKGNLLQGNDLIEPLKKALERGIIFDIGHGSSSFSFATAQTCLEHGCFEADTISTDLYEANIDYPVESLIKTVNKMLLLGIPLNRLIPKVTTVPFAAMGLDWRKAMVLEGNTANLTIFSEVSKEVSLSDSENITKISSKKLIVNKVIIKGKIYEI